MSDSLVERLRAKAGSFELYPETIGDATVKLLREAADQIEADAARTTAGKRQRFPEGLARRAIPRQRRR